MVSRDFVLAHRREHAQPTKGALKKYGITPEGYDSLLKKQKHCCAICGQHESKFKKRLAVEHNHATGFVRGLCCDYCNRKRLGSMSDNKVVWIGMMKYITKSLKEDLEWT